MDGCALLDLTCHATALGTAAIDLFPFGLNGLIFFAGMVVGERIGIWGIVIAVVGWLAIRFGKKSPDVHEHVAGKDAELPVTKPRPTIFKRR